MIEHDANSAYVLNQSFPNSERPCINDNTVQEMAKKIKYEKSFWYKFKCNRKYKKLCRQIKKCTDPRLKCSLMLERKKLLDTGVIK